MNAQSSFLPWLRRSGWAILLIALVQFVLHLWTNANDTIFRDELYYLAAGQHLAASYVDFPPFVAFVAAFSRAIFGASVFAIRLLPALAGAGIIILTADMVAMLGGRLAAQVLAAIAIALGPTFLGSSGLLTMDPFDQLWWTLGAWVVVRMIKTQQPRLWLLFGVVAGIGLLTKLTMGFFAAALLIGLLLSNQRKLLFNRWLIFGGVIALVIISPYLVWQIQNGFPVLAFTQSYAGGTKTFQATPLQYFVQQVMTQNPFALPLWLGGLFFLFFVPAGRPYRAFGWAYLLLYTFFMLQKAKFYWLTPAYPMLYASGAYGLELLVQQRSGLRWLQPTYTSIVALFGLMIVPFAIPILPAETFAAINAATGGAGDVKQENRATAELPQNYADRFGWPEMVGAVKQAYDTLTPAEQAKVCILTRNYGEAAAVDFFGPALGLPNAISGHNSYYLWGPRGCSGEVVISINRALEELTGSFESVQAAGNVSCTYCMPDENGAPIFIGRGLKAPIEDAWPTVKDFS